MAALGDEGGDDLGDLLGGEEGGEEATEGEEETLLAEPEPGQRDDWYKPVKDPKWKQGARKRSYLSATNMASSSDRNLFKGWSGQMKTLANGVVGESLDKEEQQIFEVQHEMKQLIEQMEKRNEDQTQ